VPDDVVVFQAALELVQDPALTGVAPRLRIQMRARAVSHGLHLINSPPILQAMTDRPRLPTELGELLRQRRESLGLSKTAAAERAGRVREVIYRLEGGQEASVSSLFDALRALNLVMHIEPAGLPTMEDVAAAFNRDDDDAP
jgi:HTH-type transcriptional regulator/antitoxin HipB